MSTPIESRFLRWAIWMRASSARSAESLRARVGVGSGDDRGFHATHLPGRRARRDADCQEDGEA